MLALALVELLAGLVADLLRQAQHFHALGQEGEHLVQARAEVERLEQVLLLLVLDVEQVGHHVGELARRLDRAHHLGEFLGRVRQQVDRFGRLRLQLQEARFDVRACVRGFGDPGHARDQERPAFEEFEHAEAPLALHHQVVRPSAPRA